MPAAKRPLEISMLMGLALNTKNTSTTELPCLRCDSHDSSVEWRACARTLTIGIQKPKTPKPPFMIACHVMRLNRSPDRGPELEQREPHFKIQRQGGRQIHTAAALCLLCCVLGIQLNMKEQSQSQSQNAHTQTERARSYKPR